MGEPQAVVVKLWVPALFTSDMLAACDSCPAWVAIAPTLCLCMHGYSYTQSHQGLKGSELEASVSLQRPSLAVGTKPDSVYWGRDLAQSKVLRALTKQLLRLCDAPTLSAPIVFTPRVIGTAVARYNFAARDMRELSLREGDVVKIYSRIGGDQGWWKGETNGRVSNLPGLRAS